MRWVNFTDSWEVPQKFHVYPDKDRNNELMVVGEDERQRKKKLPRERFVSGP